MRQGKKELRHFAARDGRRSHPTHQSLSVRRQQRLRRRSGYWTERELHRLEHARHSLSQTQSVTHSPIRQHGRGNEPAANTASALCERPGGNLLTILRTVAANKAPGSMDSAKMVVSSVAQSNRRLQVLRPATRRMFNDLQ
uniref:Uncharacterized protein n=1 Tax=Plectus sambesii TaxID=2011161 RepID=A0A914VN94_9BILA